MAIQSFITNQRRSDGEGTYPFIDGVTLQSQEGFTLPATFLVDATLYVPGAGSRQYLSQIVLSGVILTVTVSDQSGTICSGSVTLGTDNNEIVMKDLYDRVCGLLIGNDNTALFSGGLKEGAYNFGLGSTEFVSSVIAPQPQLNLGGVILEDDTFFSGDVWMVGKGGVVLKYNSSDNTIYVHIVGDPLFKRRKCEQDGDIFASPVPLQRLRFVMQDFNNATFDLVPDEFGNVVILPGSNRAGDNVFRIEPLDFGLRLRAIGNVIDLPGQAAQ